MIVIKKVFLFYPPGDLYQRGEDRSQGNVTDSTATSMRAPNDMAYVSAQLKKINIEVFFIDYASEGKTYKDLETDFLKFDPDLACISTCIVPLIVVDNPYIVKGRGYENPQLFLIKQGCD